LEHSQPADPSRRRTLNLLLSGSLVGFLAALVYPLVRYLIPPPASEVPASTVRVAKVEEVAPNTGLIFRFGRRPGLLIRTPDGTLRAFAATCTHLDCTVQFRPDLGLIWCACHNGRYDLTGKVISGPPPRPLTPFVVNVQDGDIYVSQGVS